MRIRFLCLYFFWNSVAIAEEISRNFLLEQYALKNYSTGLGFEKENQNNQRLYAWFHAGRKIAPKFDFNLQLTAFSCKRTIRENFPYTDKLYKFQSESEQLLFVSPGFRFYFFSLYGNFQSINPTFKGLSLGLHLYPEKSLFLFYRENPKENTHSYALSIISGKSPGIGLGIAKEISPEKTEWSGSISISFQFESFQGGTSYFNLNEKEENSFFLSKILKENTESLFEKEINPYEDENDLEKEKKKKEWEAKKFTKRERIVYEIRIEELLKFRIPLVIAIRIAKASKSKEEYVELLKKLPSDIVRKCNKIQFDKAKAKP